MEPRGEQDRSGRAALLLVLGLTCVAYVNALGGELVYDDRFQVMRNPTLRSLSSLPRAFVQSVWQFAGASDGPALGAYYRPLFNVALVTEYQLFGLWTPGWHASSLALHVLDTALLARLALAWGLTSRAALGAALVFGLHPVHSEAVAWISALPDPLATAFVLSALLAYERARAHGGAWWPTTVLAFALAALSKESVVLLPALLLLRELGEGLTSGLSLSWRTARRIFPFVAVAAAVLGARFAVLGFLTTVDTRAAGVSRLEALMTIPPALLHYVRVLVFPWPLGIAYPMPFVTSPAETRFVIAVATLAALAIAGAALLRRMPELRLPAATLLLFLVPVLDFLAFNPRESIVHDRYLYLPSIGFAMLVGAGLDALRRAAGRIPWATATALLAGTYAALTFAQNRTWADDFAMAGNALRTAPDSAFFRNYLGAARFERGDLVAAERWYREAIAVDARYFDAWSNLGDVLLQTRRASAAETAYRQAIALGAGYGKTFANLGSSLIAQRRHAEALAPFERAIAIAPGDRDARFSLAWIAQQIGDAGRAEAEYRSLLTRNPGDVPVRVNLALVLGAAGRHAEALALAREGVARFPRQPALRSLLERFERPQP